MIPIPIADAVQMLVSVPSQGRNLQMPGDPHYQPAALRPYVGYDARVGWQILAAWYWMCALADVGIMPKAHADLLTEDLLARLLRISTSQVTKVERKITRHDVLALLRLMRAILPKELHRWLHLACTSYDPICTAFALQAKWTFSQVIFPKTNEVDVIWRSQIQHYKETLQCGRTHLQTALPVTAGFWLADLHSRFAESVRNAGGLVHKIPGKFSGAVGTRAATRLFADVYGISEDLEDVALGMLDLPLAGLTTQITPPEALARYYYEITLMSAALANLGDDVRHLQSSEIGEVSTESSTSSTMSHKTGNPVWAENLDGMHVSVRCEQEKVTQTLNSTLQRVLTFSNVMRGYAAVTVFAYQQLNTAERLLKSLLVNAERCRARFEMDAKLVVAEALHLALQIEGVPDAHKLVNKKIVPAARESGANLRQEMDRYARKSRSVTLCDAWARVPEMIKSQLEHPETYLGDAVSLADSESHNALI